MKQSTKNRKKRLSNTFWRGAAGEASSNGEAVVTWPGPVPRPWFRLKRAPSPFETAYIACRSDRG